VPQSHSFELSRSISEHGFESNKSHLLVTNNVQVDYRHQKENMNIELKNSLQT